MAALTPGTVVWLGQAASVQFGGDRGLRLRIVSVDPRPTYEGWVWLTGYVLSPAGDAVAKREVFVQRAGIQVVPDRPAWSPTMARKSRPRAPA